MTQITLTIPFADIAATLPDRFDQARAAMDPAKRYVISVESDSREVKFRWTEESPPKQMPKLVASRA